MIKDLLKHNILLSAGAIIALLINIITIPIITRIYTPSDIGIFAFLHIFSIALFPILSMRMEIIFAQKIDLSELKTLFFTTVIIGIIFSFISSIILFLSANYLNQPQLINYLLFILLLPLLSTYFEYGLGILNHLKLYKSIAIFSTIGIFLQKLIQIVLGMLMEDKTSAIFLSYCIPAFVLVIVMSFVFNKKINLFKNMKFDLNTIKKYSNHIFYRVSYSLSNLFKDRLIIILIITFFSAQLAGLYTQAIGLLLIPAAIFSMPIKTIITREYQDNSNNTIDMIAIIYNIIIFTILPFYIYFFFQSSFLFPLIFGDEWSELSSVFNILMIPMFILIFSTSLDRLYDVLKVQSYAFFFELFFGLLCFGGFFVMSYMNYEFLDALKVNAIILGLFFTTFIYFILNKAQKIYRFTKTFQYFIYQLSFCYLIFLTFKENILISTFLLMLILLFGIILIKNNLKNLLAR
jgi:O-antigen/teichoic acid export membrane protein